MEADVQELTADSIRTQRMYQKGEAVGTVETVKTVEASMAEATSWSKY
jgi:hypothetical protein